MKKLAVFALVGVCFFGLGLTIDQNGKQKQNQNMEQNDSEALGMDLGAFSVSLSVKDLKVSKAFYEKMGFDVLGGDMEKNYLIMKNGNALIGLFQGMFEGNILTFNPGWDESGENKEDWEDIRKIQEKLQKNGLEVPNAIDTKGSGPASIILSDPDGNVIFLDQHR